MRIALVVLFTVASVLVAGPANSAPVASAATCTSSVGPGIPPPASVPSGLFLYDASWYGQSGYPTLCPGESTTLTVAFYNSGTHGWYAGKMGEMAFLGTWWPQPGQDRASVLGGDGTNGSPATGWPRYNRPAAQSAPYIGPGQVSWFQFRITAPMTPGSYRLHVRPLIEGFIWMQDAGVYWQVTVKTDDAEQSVILDGVDTAQDRFTASSSTFQYDSGDTFQYAGAAMTMAQFEQVLSRGDTVTMRYDPDPADRSTFNIAIDAGQDAPVLYVTGSVGRVHVEINEPATNVDGARYSLQRASVTNTGDGLRCNASSGTYVEIAGLQIPPGSDQLTYADEAPPRGTLCYRAGTPNPLTGAVAFGYSVFTAAGGP